MQLQNKATRAVRRLAGLPLLFVSASTLAAQFVGAFTPTGNMTGPRSQHTATLLFDGRVLIAGGVIIDHPTPASEILRPTATAEIYDPSTGLFAPTGSMTDTRMDHTATLLADGRVLIAGGASRTAELYDPSTGVFTATGSLSRNQSVASATLLRDGRVFVVGYGYEAADLYDPSTGTFTPTGPRLAEGPRKAVLQPDGNVLLLPAWAYGSGSQAIELYNPRNNTFSRSAWPFVQSFDLFENFAVGYSTATANLLKNGKVLLTLRSVESVLNSYALLFDPSTGTFSGTGALTGRLDQSATSLSDETVLITGGVGHQCGQVPPKAEVYDVVSGTFSITDTNPYRTSYTATLLKDGQVLIAGGVGCPKAGSFYLQLASAELYRPASPSPPARLLSLSGDGRGPGAVQHADTVQLVSDAHPAVAGEILTLYCAGLAQDSVIPPQVSIGGRMAEIHWFGNTPGYAELSQINARVPVGVTPGPAVAVRLIYAGRPGNEVAIAVR